MPPNATPLKHTNALAPVTAESKVRPSAESSNSCYFSTNRSTSEAGEVFQESPLCRNRAAPRLSLATTIDHVGESYESDDEGASSMTTSPKSLVYRDKHKLISRPSPSFLPHYKERTHERIPTVLKPKLSPAHIQRRTIYGFRNSPSAPHIKIGVTRDFTKRMVQLPKCGMFPNHLVFRFETNHAGLVEKLIHVHLARERRNEIFTTIPSCGHGKHTEWFEVSDDRAKIVAEGWRKWMELEPYFQDQGKYWVLKESWRSKLPIIDQDSGEQDFWLSWLDSNVPGFACDTESPIQRIVQTLSTTPATIVMQGPEIGAPKVTVQAKPPRLPSAAEHAKHSAKFRDWRVNVDEETAATPTIVDIPTRDRLRAHEVIVERKVYPTPKILPATAIKTPHLLLHVVQHIILLCVDGNKLFSSTVAMTVVMVISALTSNVRLSTFLEESYLPKITTDLQQDQKACPSMSAGIVHYPVLPQQYVDERV